MNRVSLGGVAYIFIGVIIVCNSGYLNGLGPIPHLLSAVLAVALRPLVLLGINLELAF